MDNETTATTAKTTRKRRVLVVTGLAAVLAGAVGIASAAGVGPAMAGHGFCRHGMGRDFVEFRIQKALQKVNASAAQEQQIMAIVDDLFAKHQAMAADRQKLHQRIAAALTGATVDRAALEAVRADAVQRMDQCSKDLAKAIGDIAEILTPAQRQQLAALHAQHFE